MIVKLYQKQLLFTKLGKLRGKFWFSELWPRVLNITVSRRVCVHPVLHARDTLNGFATS